MRLNMSFWKQEPPKPMEAFRNLGPTRESLPMAAATSSTSAPVASHRAEIELIDEIRCARKALATSFESSDDQMLLQRIFSRGTQRAYISTSFSLAARPLFVSS